MIIGSGRNSTIYVAYFITQLLLLTKGSANYRTIYLAKLKTLIGCAFTVQVICALALHMQNSFSYDAAQNRTLLATISQQYTEEHTQLVISIEFCLLRPVNIHRG